MIKLISGTLYRVNKRGKEDYLIFSNLITKKYEKIDYPEVLMYLETTPSETSPDIDRHWFLTSRGTKVYCPCYYHNQEWLFGEKFTKVSQ